MLKLEFIPTDITVPNLWAYVLLGTTSSNYQEAKTWSYLIWIQKSKELLET